MRLAASIGRARIHATYDRILADDFVDSSWKGEVGTKRQVLERLSKPLPYSQHLRNVKVTFYGSIALARGLNEIRDKNGRIVMRIRFIDVFLYRHGYWHAVAAQETPMRSRESVYRFRCPLSCQSAVVDSLT